MFEGIVAIVIGVVLVLFLANFIANSNTDSLTTTDTLLLGITPTIALVMIIWGFIKAMREAKFGI